VCQKYFLPHYCKYTKNAKLISLSEKILTSPYSFNMSKKIQYLVISLLALLLYANTIGNRYSLDDDYVINRNESAQQGFVETVTDIVTTHYSVTEKSRFEYRPVVKITFAAEYSIWGNNPHLSHIVNLLIFLITVLLLFKILSRLFGEKYPWLPFLSTLLFIAHPIHTEVVASLKNRDELLAFLFSMWSAWLMIKFCDTRKWYFLVLSVPVYLVAYFSKSSALVFVALIPLILWFAGVRNYKYYLAGFVLIAFTAWFARWIPGQILPGAHREVWGFENPIYEHRGILFRLGTGLVALLFYLRLLIVPYPLRFYYGFDTIPLTHFPDWLSVLSLLIHVGLLLLALAFIRKRHPLSFAILFYLIAISMFSNILKPAVGIVAERYIYAASTGFCIALAYFVLKLFRYEDKPLVSWVGINKGVRMLMLCLVFVYGARTISRNSVWKDHLTLFYNDIPHLKNSFKANFLLAATLQVEVSKTLDNPKLAKRNAKYLADAEVFYSRALEIFDRYPVAWNSMGSFRFMFKNETEMAMKDFKQALSLDPNYTEALYNMGFAFVRKTQYDSAIVYFDKSIRSDPKYLKGYNEKGLAMLNLNDTTGFLETQEIMKKKFPESDFPYINLGNYFLSLKDTATAFHHWESAAERNPDNQPLVLNLANFYARKGNQEKSNYYMRLYRQSVQKQKKQKKD